VPEDAGDVDFELALTQTASLSYKSGGADSAVEPQQEKSMSDNDNESGVSGLGWFLAGLGIGALVGVLYAPKAGKETREELVASALDARDRAAVLAQQAQDKAADLANQGKQQVSEYVDRGKEYYDRGRTQWAQYVEKGKGLIQEHQNKVSAAIDAGKDAYASTTSEPTS
jgi:gas vesicle protein